MRGKARAIRLPGMFSFWPLERDLCEGGRWKLISRTTKVDEAMAKLRANCQEGVVKCSAWEVDMKEDAVGHAPSLDLLLLWRLVRPTDLSIAHVLISQAILEAYGKHLKEYWMEQRRPIVKALKAKLDDREFVSFSAPTCTLSAS